MWRVYECGTHSSTDVDVPGVPKKYLQQVDALLATTQPKAVYNRMRLDNKDEDGGPKADLPTYQQVSFGDL